MLDPSLRIASVESQEWGWVLHMRDGATLQLYHAERGRRLLTVRDIRDSALDCESGGEFKRAHLLRQIASAQSLSVATG